MASGLLSGLPPGMALNCQKSHFIRHFCNAKKLGKFDTGNVKIGLTEMHLLFEALLKGN